MATKARLPGSMQRRLGGFLLSASEPENRAQNDQRSANHPADGRSPVVDPRENNKLHVQKIENYRADSEEEQRATELFHGMWVGLSSDA